MVTKEWSCKECGTEFEGLLSVCPECGRITQRAFRTPVGITTARHRQHDQIIESEMRVRGMTNYTNRDGISRPTFSGNVQHGAVRGSWGPAALDGFVAANGVPLAAPSVPMNPVQIAAGQNIRNQAGVNRIIQRSVSLGRTDMHGNQVALKTLPV